MRKSLRISCSGVDFWVRHETNLDLIIIAAGISFLHKHHHRIMKQSRFLNHNLEFDQSRFTAT